MLLNIINWGLNDFVSSVLVPKIFSMIFSKVFKFAENILILMIPFHIYGCPHGPMVNTFPFYHCDPHDRQWVSGRARSWWQPPLNSWVFSGSHIIDPLTPTVMPVRNIINNQLLNLFINCCKINIVYIYKCTHIKDLMSVCD